MPKSNMKKRSPLDTERSFRFRPGWIIRDCSVATGGVTYQRTLVDEEIKNRRMVSDYETRKTVDNVEFVATIDAVVKKVDYILRKYCTRTDMGWFADDTRLGDVKREVAQLRVEAEALNGAAKAARSARRAKIRVAALKLDLAQPEAVAEIADTIRSVLSEMLEALRAGDIGSMHKLKIRAMNLDLLATGIQSDAIRFAVERALQAVTEIKLAVRNLGGDPAVAASKAGKALDLEMIEAAIAHFTVPDVHSVYSRNQEVA